VWQIAKFEPGLGQDIVVPVREGQRGNPVLWGRRYFNRMQELEGDAGARDLLQEYAANVSRIEVADESIFVDIDTTGTLAEVMNADAIQQTTRSG